MARQEPGKANLCYDYDDEYHQSIMMMKENPHLVSVYTSFCVNAASDGAQRTSPHTGHLLLLALSYLGSVRSLISRYKMQHLSVGVASSCHGSVDSLWMFCMLMYFLVLARFRLTSAKVVRGHRRMTFAWTRILNE